MPRIDDPSHTFLATCARGTESLLETEILRELPTADNLRPVSGGVLFDGGIDVGMAACLHLRIANRVQLRLLQTSVRDEDGVYDTVRSLEPSIVHWVGPDHTLAVRGHARDDNIRNGHYLALRIKDAVVDAQRDALGRRSSVDKDAPDVQFAAHVIKGTLRVFVELQGAPLSQRGYRPTSGRAPLRETLAAALLEFSGWRGNSPLHDPMCGAATIPIEAAWIARATAPGLLRAVGGAAGIGGFGFERWPHFDSELADTWRTLVDAARAWRRRDRLPTILATDTDRRVIDVARTCVKRARLGSAIEPRIADACELQPLHPPGHFVFNPPWGTRLQPEQNGQLIDLYERVSSRVHACDGHTLTLLAPPALLKRAIHLRPDATQRIPHGTIDVQMARYRIGRQHAK